MENSLIIEYLEDRFYPSNRFMNEAARKYWPISFTTADGTTYIFNGKEYKSDGGLTKTMSKTKAAQAFELYGIEDKDFPNGKKIGIPLPDTFEYKGVKFKKDKFSDFYLDNSNESPVKISSKTVEKALKEKDPNRIIEVGGTSLPNRITVGSGVLIKQDDKWVDKYGQSYTADDIRAILANKSKRDSARMVRANNYKAPSKSSGRIKNDKIVKDNIAKRDAFDSAPFKVGGVEYYQNPNLATLDKLFTNNKMVYYVVGAGNKLLVSANPKFISNYIFDKLSYYNAKSVSRGYIYDNGIGYYIYPVNYFDNDKSDLVLYTYTSRNEIDQIKKDFKTIKNHFSNVGAPIKPLPFISSDTFFGFVSSIHKEYKNKISLNKWLNGDYKNMSPDDLDPRTDVILNPITKSRYNTGVKGSSLPTTRYDRGVKRLSQEEEIKVKNEFDPTVLGINKNKYPIKHIDYDKELKVAMIQDGVMDGYGNLLRPVNYKEDHTTVVALLAKHCNDERQKNWKEKHLLTNEQDMALRIIISKYRFDYQVLAAIQRALGMCTTPGEKMEDGSYENINAVLNKLAISLKGKEAKKQEKRKFDDLLQMCNKKIEDLKNTKLFKPHYNDFKEIVKKYKGFPNILNRVKKLLDLFDASALKTVLGKNGRIHYPDINRELIFLNDEIKKTIEVMKNGKQIR